MSDMKLYTQAGSFRAMKILIAAKYAGVPVEVVAMQMGKDNETPEYLAKNPMGKGETLETPDGCLFESNACARYVARLRADKTLYGESFFESGEVDQWMDFSAHELELPVSMWVYPILGWIQTHPVAVPKAQDDCKRALAHLEGHLATRTYMVGKTVTLADLTLFAAMYYPMKLVWDKNFLKPFTNVLRWFTTVANQPEVLAVVGPTQLCQKALAVPGASADAAAKGGKAKGGKAKGGKAKGEKKAAAAPKVEEKKEEKPKTLKDIINALPKSKWNMDEWKRTFSGVDRTEATQRKAMEYLWANMDWEGYSLFNMDYNYKDEHTKDWMCANGVKGFQQRCEEMRKWAFGMNTICGPVGKYFQVMGAWLVRGTTNEYLATANDECEYYTWSKVEKDDEAAKKKFEDRMCLGWTPEQSIEGMAIYDILEFK